MPMKLFVDGSSGGTCANFEPYSNPFTTMNPTPKRNVRPMCSLNFPMSFIFSAAHDSTIVTDEAMRMIVFSVASGTFRIDDCTGQLSAPTRSSTYEEKSDPKSITSDARNSQIPSFGL